MGFTRLDRNLLVRVGKELARVASEQDAKVAAVRDSGDLKQAQKEKSRADVLHRDLRDLEELRHRLTAACEGAVTMRPVEEKGAPDGSAG